MLLQTTWKFKSFDVAFGDATYPRWTQIDYIGDLRQENKDAIWSVSKLKQLQGAGVASAANDEKSFAWTGMANSIRLSTMQLYGKTMEGRSVRVDVPFCASFLWRFPLHYGRDRCLQIWDKFRKILNPDNNLTLDDLVFFVQFEALGNAQRFDFGRQYPHLRLSFASKADMYAAHTWLDQFSEGQDDVRTITSKTIPSLLPEEERLYIQLFETKIKPIFMWNRKYYNLNAWLSVEPNQYYTVEDEVRDKTTSCRNYLFVTAPLAIDLASRL